MFIYCLLWENTALIQLKDVRIKTHTLSIKRVLCSPIPHSNEYCSHITPHCNKLKNMTANETLLMHVMAFLQ